MTLTANPDATSAERRGRQPGDAPARWHILYQAMAELVAGELLSYERMAKLLGLDPQLVKDRQAISVSARKASDELRKRDRKVALLIRGKGYGIAQPDVIIGVARRHQELAVAQVEAGFAKVDTIDLTQLDVTTARIVEATLMGFARQQAMMRQLDVRQNRLETVMAAVAATAHTAATQSQETSTRVTAHDQQIAGLRAQIERLESASGQRMAEPKLPEST